VEFVGSYKFRKGVKEAGITFRKVVGENRAGAREEVQ